MKELHTDSINGGHEASYGLSHVSGGERTPTKMLVLLSVNNAEGKNEKKSNC